MDKLSLYRAGRLVLPAENLAWQLYGAGLENFGRNGRPARLPMPGWGRDELLARVDAIGICFSDVKLIAQGSSHPRITGRDLGKGPVVPGHEVSLTIVGVGEDLKGRFAVGDRFVVQADVYYRGANLAFGYALAGGMQQYVVLGDEVLRGDEGCYLIPVRPETGYAEAALTEPWACVVASYRIHPRREMREDGVALFLGPAGRPRYALPRGSRPGKAILAGVGQSIDRAELAGSEIVEIGPVQGHELAALAQERTGERGFDDIIVLGRMEPELIEALDRHLARGGVLNVVGDEPAPGPVAIDVGRVHYDGVLYVGGGEIGQGYRESRDSELRAGGTAWFVGAGGPMGQMHVERAVQMQRGPARILATDVDDARLEALSDRVLPLAEQKGIEITFVNPAAEERACSFRAVSAELTGGRGFDDIVVLAPVPALIEQAARCLADGGLLNIFAGVPRGTIAEMDLSAVQRGARFVGSSGSRPADLEFTLHEAETGDLATNRSVAAIGGIDAVGDGVRAVKEARFPGRIVIFPQIGDLPLLSAADLREALPGVYAKLDGGRFWTREAEQELLREALG